MKVDATGLVELVGMEFHAFHGCLEQERTEGNTFLVDFCGKVEIREAARTDDLADTPDYGQVYRIVEREMAKPSNLLENVAGRIVDAVVRERLGFLSIRVRVSKKSPPVGGACSWSRVTATFGAEGQGGDSHSGDSHNGSCP